MLTMVRVWLGIILFPLKHTHTHTHTPGVDGGGKGEIRQRSYSQDFNFLIGKVIYT